MNIQLQIFASERTCLQPFIKSAKNKYNLTAFKVKTGVIQGTLNKPNKQYHFLVKLAFNVLIRFH